MSEPRKKRVPGVSLGEPTPHNVNSLRMLNSALLAVRYGKSNPHSSIGYFIHPRVSKLLVDWLHSDNLGDLPRYTL